MIRTFPWAVLVLFVMALIAVVMWPHFDIIATSWFYVPGRGFPLEDSHLFGFLHHCAIRGAWALGFLFAALVVVSFVLEIICDKSSETPLPLAGGVGGGLVNTSAVGPSPHLTSPASGRGIRAVLHSKNWLFLLLALLIGPVLIANGTLKDHWGRARPREVVEFGGHAQFSPALMPQPDATRNGSFVSGDGAFGFFLPSFAYLVPLGSRRKQSQQVFWVAIAVGGIFAFTRLASGAHFLSDNLFAGWLMLGISAALHSAMFGARLTKAYWRAWFNLPTAS